MAVCDLHERLLAANRLVENAWNRESIFQLANRGHSLGDAR